MHTCVLVQAGSIASLPHACLLILRGAYMSSQARPDIFCLGMENTSRGEDQRRHAMAKPGVKLFRSRSTFPSWSASAIMPLYMPANQAFPKLLISAQLRVKRNINSHAFHSHCSSHGKQGVYVDSSFQLELSAHSWAAFPLAALPQTLHSSSVLPAC